MAATLANQDVSVGDATRYRRSEGKGREGQGARKARVEGAENCPAHAKVDARFLRVRSNRRELVISAKARALVTAIR